MPSEIKQKIISAVKEAIGREKKVGILFSGGVDSSVIAKIASKHCGVTCYVAGLEGSHDILFAQKAAKALKLRLKKKVLKPYEVEKYVKLVTATLDSCDLVQVGVGIPLFAGCEIAEEKVILTGLGADEIFGGYARFRRMQKKQLNAELKRTYENMLEVDLQRDIAVGAANGKIMKAPYIETGIKPLGEVDKPTLRKVAIELGIPKFIAHKPKKAAQYGSGVDRLLKNML